VDGENAGRLIFVNFERKIIRVSEKEEAFASSRIDPDFFQFETMGQEMASRLIEVRHNEGKMPQTAGLRSAWA
jgi:hypothetical protein